MKKALLSLFLIAAVFSCKEDDLEPTQVSKTEVLTTYAEIVYANYEDAVSTAKVLQTAINDFLAAPSEEGLIKARQAWIDSRNPYGQTEAFRFYGGPIDSEDGPEGLINGWPLDESYIDYVEGNANSGIINDAVSYPVIDAQTLIDANENGSETNLSTGYHAIEFLLWGQDLYEDSPGKRAYTDYTTAPNAARRAEYLKVVTDLLIENLTEVMDAWAPSTAYRASFIAGGDESIAKMFRGIGALSKGELAGERMTVALANKDQEDEHSCFSDNTKADIEMNFRGIRNVYVGAYERVDGSQVTGASLADLVNEKDLVKNETILNLLSATFGSIIGIPQPFDSALRAGDPGKKIENTIINLRNLSDAIVDGALQLGIQVNAELD
ncbi:MAG: peptidase m75, imelysin [Cytophagales bacterium]|nr:peptidase m75, imelysin [Cytophagales bacterium]